MKITPILLVIAAVAASTLAAQTIISVNISDAAGNNDMAPSEVAGIATEDARANNWNNINATYTATLLGSEAIFDDGAAVNGTFQVDFTTSNDTFIASGSVSNDPLMFRGNNNLFNTDTNSVTVSGIPFSQYSLIIYTTGGTSTRGGSISLSGGQTYYNKGGATPDSSGNGYTTITSTTYDSLNPGVGVGSGNYVIYEGLTSSSLTFSMASMNMGDATTQRQALHGFQIVSTIPEPATYAMMFGSGVLVFALRRRKR